MVKGNLNLGSRIQKFNAARFKDRYRSNRNLQIKMLGLRLNLGSRNIQSLNIRFKDKNSRF